MVSVFLHFHWSFSNGIKAVKGLIMRDKVSRQCPQTTAFEGRRTEADSNPGPSPYQPN